MICPISGNRMIMSCFRGLLVADKSGDVYHFNTEGEEEGQLLLGETLTSARIQT